MNMDHLPEWLQEELDNCPSAGGGVHTWLFKMARLLHWHVPNQQGLADLLEAKVQGCGRDVPRREIEAAVADSRVVMWRPGGGSGGYLHVEYEDEDCDQGRPRALLSRPAVRTRQPLPRRPDEGLNRIALNLPLLRDIVLNGVRLSCLRDLSPVNCVIPSGYRMATLVLEVLFGDGLLCCGYTQSEFDTNPLKEWEDLWSMAFVVPNPMIAPQGRTKDGRLSAHTLDNTGPRRFLVVECDFGLLERDGKTRKPCAVFVEEMAALGITIADISAAVLMHLSAYAPLVLIVSSGGKSLHGWFYCGGDEEEEFLTFFRYAISLGADWRMWLRSQFARMPDGTRDNGKRQEVLYFDPRPLGDSHLSDQVRRALVQMYRSEAGED